MDSCICMPIQEMMRAENRRQNETRKAQEGSAQKSVIRKPTGFDQGIFKYRIPSPPSETKHQPWLGTNGNEIHSR